MKKQETGITLIALIVTIIVLLIIAGISLGSGNISIKETKSKAALTELNSVQHAALERYTKVSLTKEEYPGTRYQTIEEVEQDISEIKSEITLKDRAIENPTNYYWLTKEDLKDLGITNSEDEYIINYELGEVINKTSFKTGDNQILYLYAKER